jgi:peptidoglycan/xylan/chitin deacetylase (PgdA/CDA1 family)
VSLFRRASLAGRRIIKAVYLQILFVTGLLKWARLNAAKRGVVVITMHQVVPDAQYESAGLLPGMAVRASTFRSLLEYMTRHCQLILPGQAVDRSDLGPTGERPRVALTFDDGWKDNFEVAFPISREYGVPFTVFICPEAMARQRAFWTSRVNHLWRTAQQAGKLDLVQRSSGAPLSQSAEVLVERLKRVGEKQREVCILQLEAALAPRQEDEAAVSTDQLLTWSEIRKMASAGVAFGSHTNNHSILTDISAGEAIEELRGSKSAIEAELNVCSWFAYPNGDCSPSVRDLVARTGYQLAFLNSAGLWEKDSDPLSIPRVNAWEGSLTGLNGRFSRMTLEYAVFWKAYRSRNQSKRAVN